MKLYVLDGLENTGKTTIINQLKRDFDMKGVVFAKFPSERLINKFPYVVTDNCDNDEIKRRFIRNLIAEGLKNLRLAEYAIVDRLMLSTLIYQGREYHKNNRINSIIISSYLNLFEELNVEEVNTFIFDKELESKSKEENEIKKTNDLKNNVFRAKLTEIYKNITRFSDILGFVYTDYDLRDYFGDDNLLQKKRLSRIRRMLLDDMIGK